MSGGKQRRVLPPCKSEQMKKINISFPRVGIEPTTSRVYNYVVTFWALHKRYKIYFLNLILIKFKTQYHFFIVYLLNV